MTIFDNLRQLMTTSELVSSDKYLVDSNWSNTDTGGKMETFLDIREVLDKGAMQTFLTDYVR